MVHLHEKAIPSEIVSLCGKKVGDPFDSWVPLYSLEVEDYMQDGLIDCPRCRAEWAKRQQALRIFREGI